jgi:hypothetical protein
VSTDPKGAIVRVFVFVASVIVATALTMGAILLVVFTAPRHTGALIALPTAAVSLLIYGPMLLGSLSAYWQPKTTTESRRSFRIWYIVVGSLELVAAIAIAVYAALMGAPIWLPLVLIAGGALLNVLAIAVGRLVLRHEIAHRPLTQEWTPITRRDIIRKCIKVAITFAVVFVVALILFTVLGNAGSHSISHFGVQLSLAFEFGAIAAAFACIVVTLPLNRQIRETVGRDLGTIRKLAKVVLRKKDIPLDENEQVAAAKYAVVIAILLSFTLGYISLLYIGIAIQQVTVIFNEGSVFAVGELVILVIVLLALFPLQIVRIMRARRYAREHADLLPTTSATPIA